MSDISNILLDLSNSIYTLQSNFSITDISNQILNLQIAVNDLNNKAESLLQLYHLISDLKDRVDVVNN
tara:strand:- start:163 stop:366 length:204 start_codon:yes stop_codon:yes gene_type:complete